MKKSEVRSLTVEVITCDLCGFETLTQINYRSQCVICGRDCCEGCKQIAPPGRICNDCVKPYQKYYAKSEALDIERNDKLNAIKKEYEKRGQKLYHDMEMEALREAGVIQKPDRFGYSIRQPKTKD